MAGVALLTTVRLAATMTPTVAVDGGEVTGFPAGSEPPAVAVLVIEPLSISVCVAV